MAAANKMNNPLPEHGAIDRDARLDGFRAFRNVGVGAAKILRRNTLDEGRHRQRHRRVAAANCGRLFAAVGPQPFSFDDAADGRLITFENAAMIVNQIGHRLTIAFRNINLSP